MPIPMAPRVERCSRDVSSMTRDRSAASSRESLTWGIVERIKYLSRRSFLRSSRRAKMTPDYGHQGGDPGRGKRSQDLPEGKIAHGNSILLELARHAIALGCRPSRPHLQRDVVLRKDRCRPVQQRGGHQRPDAERATLPASCESSPNRGDGRLLNPLQLPLAGQQVRPPVISVISARIRPREYQTIPAWSRVNGQGATRTPTASHPAVV